MKLDPTALQGISNYNRVVSALSGGIDSVVLLDLLAKQTCFADKQILLAHLNHGLSPAANDWRQFCQTLATQYGYAFVHETITQTLTPGASLEAWAREARYAWLATLMDSQTILLTAHHADDQAETVLLQLFRGSGVAGLAAMPEMTPFATGYHWRPLLKQSRAQIQRYAHEHNLTWVDDESNENLNLDRNFLRQTVIPQLKTRWPSLTKTISRSAQCCADATHVLEVFAQEQWLSLVDQQTQSIRIDKFRDWSSAQQRIVLRDWLAHMGASIPSFQQLERMIQDLILSRTDARGSVIWGQHQLNYWQGRLYLLPRLTPALPREPVLWPNLSQCLSLANGRQLQAQLEVGQGIRLTEHERVDIRFRQGGERILLNAKLGHQSLKHLFQTWQIPPWERAQIPLIYVDGVLAAVVGYAMAQAFRVEAGETGWVFI